MQNIIEKYKNSEILIDHYVENVAHYFGDFDKKKKIIIWKAFDNMLINNYWLWLYFDSFIIINIIIFTIINNTWHDVIIDYDYILTCFYYYKYYYF